MVKLFVYIDESGQINPINPIFSTAAVWCMPSDNVGERMALKTTWKFLIGYLRDYYGHRISEIKYSHNARNHANVLLGMIESIAASDPTILSKD